jgi:hypothetical protein
MALCTPISNAAALSNGRDRDASTSQAPSDVTQVEGDYRWVREFVFNPQRESEGSRSYGFVFTENAAYYMPIRASYLLSKRKLQEFVDVPIPEKVCTC